MLAPGTANNPTGANITRTAPVDALDGRWHMVTLTSQPGGRSGYRCTTVPVPLGTAHPLHVRQGLLTRVRLTDSDVTSPRHACVQRIQE